MLTLLYRSSNKEGLVVVVSQYGMAVKLVNRYIVSAWKINCQVGRLSAIDLLTLLSLAAVVDTGGSPRFSLAKNG